MTFKTKTILVNVLCILMTVSFAAYAIYKTRHPSACVEDVSRP